MLPLEFIRANAPFLKSRLTFFGSITLYVFAAAIGVATFILYSDASTITVIPLEDSLKMTDELEVSLNGQ